MINLPILSKKTVGEPHLYLALLIGDTRVQAALWRADSVGVTLLESSSSLVYSSASELAQTADQALQYLGPSSEDVDEVVLGLATNWTDDAGIIPAKKPILKEMTEKLGLKPVGFVVTAEALAKHLSHKSPRLSALLVEFGANHLTLSYLQQGQLLISKEVGRSAQTLADMTEALARVNAHYEDQHQEQLFYPPKILLASFELDQKVLKSEQQLIIDHDWLNSHPFKQMPTVELIGEVAFLEAVVYQGGKSVAAAAGVTLSSSAQSSGDVVRSSVDAGGDSTVEKKSMVMKPAKGSKSVESGAESLESSSAPESPVNEKASVTSSTFGIPLSVSSLPDVAKKQTNQESPGLSLQEKVEVSPSTVKQKKGVIMKFVRWFQAHKTFAIGGFVAGLVVLFILGYWWLAANTQAYLSLVLNTQAVSQETSLTLDPERKISDPDNLILAAQTITQEVTATADQETTGTKLVGEPAQGTVTIFNKTEAAKTFEAGTVLSRGDLNFTLDEEVEVASASVETTATGESKEYGQITAAVTASQIGAESNLEEDSELQLASFDLGTYSAVVAENLSGGSSREVRVVAEADRTKLRQALIEQLVKEAENKFKEELSAEESLVPTNEYRIVKENYNAEVGDELNTLELSLTLEVEALSYYQENLLPLAQKVLATDVPEGYVLMESDPQILSEPVEGATDSGQISLEVNLTAEAEPELNQEELKAELAGQDLEEAQQTLEAREAIKEVVIRLQPKLAESLRPRLPEDSARINFIQSED